ncbi:MAG: hypothetical protein Q9216_004959 [Gyalolechia sp. 2 TL-2023]
MALSTITPSKPSPGLPNNIDGVLLRSSNPLPRARQILTALQHLRIPFILLTNGGGQHERDRVRQLSHLLSVPIAPSMFIQSHTPFADLIDSTNPGDDLQTPLKDKAILVTGGDGERCRKVAEDYGFRNVIIPADIITSCPSLWPFTSPQNYSNYARPLPLPIYNPSLGTLPSPSTLGQNDYLQIHSIFVFNDPRDWALDTQIILDILLSNSGILGTQNPSRQPTQQVPLYFSNPDLHWASQYHLPRLGQGGFQAAFKGVWDAVTDGKLPLQYTLIGKPSQSTFEFAEKRLVEHRKELLGITPDSEAGGVVGLRKVYMVGDNPESDIAGGNKYQSALGSQWETILVKSGVHVGGEPAHTPSVTVDGVWDAVEWALDKEGWLDGVKLEPKERSAEENNQTRLRWDPEVESAGYPNS